MPVEENENGGLEGKKKGLLPLTSVQIKKKEVQQQGPLG